MRGEGEHYLERILLKQLELIELMYVNNSGDPRGDVVIGKINAIINNNGPGSSNQNSYIQEGGASVGDTYMAGQGGAFGPGARAEGNTFIQQSNQQAVQAIDLNALATELGQLRSHLRASGSGSAEEDIALSELAQAEISAKKNDRPGAMSHLAKVGKWALDAATALGVGVAVAAIKAAMGAS